MKIIQLLSSHCLTWVEKCALFDALNNIQPSMINVLLTKHFCHFKRGVISAKSNHLLKFQSTTTELYAGFLEVFFMKLEGVFDRECCELLEEGRGIG